MSESSVIGALDLFVIGGVTGLLLYYFVFRKRQKEVPSFSKLNVRYRESFCFMKVTFYWNLKCDVTVGIELPQPPPFSGHFCR